jgi:hypothetical protein
MTQHRWDTPILDGELAQRGYALNKMCFSFNSAANRAEFQRDEFAYCCRFGLNEAQKAAVEHRNVLEMLKAGEISLSCKARRHLWAECPRHRCTADRNERRGVQERTVARRSINNGSSRRCHHDRACPGYRQRDCSRSAADFCDWSGQRVSLCGRGLGFAGHVSAISGVCPVFLQSSAAVRSAIEPQPREQDHRRELALHKAES